MSDDPAAGRFLIINAVRATGVGLVMLGLLVLRDVIELPDLAGYILVVAGLFDVFVAPTLLARKWRTPPE